MKNIEKKNIGKEICPNCFGNNTWQWSDKPGNVYWCEDCKDAFIPGKPRKNS